MNEIKKTSIFVALAVILSLITWFTGGPKIGDVSVKDLIGKFLFPDFTKAEDAVNLEIVKYDDDTGATATFKVGQVNGLWCIPSHSDYPADAKDRIADVASGLMDLEVLEIPAGTGEGAEKDDVQALHEEFGVIDPTASDLGGGEGVGTRVIMSDQSGKELLSLIVGKAVPDQDNLRFVRRAGQDPVYTVALDTGKLTTKFEDWIEKDLLKLSYWDIKQVEIEDYSVDILAGRQVPRGQMTLAYDDSADDKWSLAVDKIFQKEGWVDKGMGEDEELDKTKLDAMRSAVGDLKIVDVARKPEGLSADLKGGDIKIDEPTRDSLMGRGFYLVPVQDPSDPSKRFYDLLSNEGQISILLKNGVRYVLRFGQIAGTPTPDEDDEEKEEKPAQGEEEEKPDQGEEAEEDKEESSPPPGANRYLFVMVQFDSSPIEKPELEKLPELPKKTDAEKTDAEKTDAEKPQGEKPDAKKPQGEKPDAKKPEGEKPEDDGAKADDAESDAAEEKAEIEKERERIEKENKRKQEEYDGKITEGKEKVDELNVRFADWYYIISNGVFDKIHLGRDDVVKEKEKEEATEGEETPAASKAPPATPADAVPAPAAPAPAPAAPAKPAPETTDAPANPLRDGDAPKTEGDAPKTEGDAPKEPASEKKE